MRSIRFLFKMRFFPSSYLKRIGYFKSVDQKQPVDINGQPIPWMSYPMIQFLQDRLTPEHTLVEYGSGYSTLFFSRYVGKVDAVEHNREWYERISKRVPGNANVDFINAEDRQEYVGYVEKRNAYADVVVVDGRFRVDCAAASAEVLKKSAVIVFDDTDRERYREIYGILENRGYRYIEFEGLKPAKFEESRGTVFYRDNNVFGI